MKSAVVKSAAHTSSHLSSGSFWLARCWAMKRRWSSVSACGGRGAGERGGHPRQSEASRGESMRLQVEGRVELAEGIGRSRKESEGIGSKQEESRGIRRSRKESEANRRNPKRNQESEEV